MNQPTPREPTDPDADLPERPAWNEGRRLWVCGPRASARAFYLNRWYGRAPAPTLVLVATPADARRWVEDLTFFAGSGSTVLYPSWEVMPFDLASPPSALLTARIEALWAIHDGTARFLVAPVDAVAKRTLRPEDLARHSMRLAVTGELDLTEAAGRLVEMGYRAVPTVEDRGEFSVRGGILDVFPPGRELPVRVDLFGDRIEGIKSFNIEDQRSREAVERLEILPARELLFGPETLPGLCERIRARADALDIGRVARQRLIEELEAGILAPGSEWLVPFAFPDLGDVFDYLAPASVVVIDDSLGFEAALERTGRRIDDGVAFAQARKHLMPEPEALFHDADGLRARIDGFRRLSFEGVEIHAAERTGATLSLACDTHEELRARLKDLKGDDRHLQPLADRIAAWRADGLRTVLVCHTDSQGERLRELLEDYDLYPTPVHLKRWGPDPAAALPPLGLAIGPLNDGFALHDRRLAIVAEEEIFGQRLRPRRARRVRDFIASIQDIHAGDFVVHVDHGIGRYVGLERKRIGDEEEDFLALEYAAGDRLFVPVQKINLVQRYVGADEAPPKLSKLGGVAWEKAKSRARRAIEDMTDELVELYAKRALARRKPFGSPDHHFREFEATFGYEETPDQASAIDDVLRDLQNDRPMDRLVCGDVGYGKTEVAIRAAFKAVSDGRQVAVLVPTTVLCQQHTDTFRERMKPYAVEVAQLSRFVARADQKEILDRLARGRVDVVIGTQRLLSADVKFKDLGLLVIDEEHRFGVKQKERIKAYRTQVDVLTMTATPIPRTMHMALSGLRELSVINTPPPDRVAVRTRVIRFDSELIREAILREVRRGGQVFYVHNRVEDIAEHANFVRELVPEARVRFAHGQMTEHGLEKVMLGFLHRDFDVLVTTTIIESGLDIPSANTILVNHADKFGLAQLYQIRGRVGRSSEQAYALFIVHEPQKLTAEARQRLQVLQQFSELSSGFKVATYDLEIRGAGNLLGRDQSGQISAIGFDLYTEMLDQAIANAKGEEPPPEIEPEIHLGERLYIPEEYVADMNQRLLFYKRLSKIERDEDAVEIRDELIDRFGPTPEIVDRLIGMMRVRMAMRSLLIESLVYDRKSATLSFHRDTPVGPDRVLALIQSDPRKYALSKDFKLSIRAPDLAWEALLREVRTTLDRLRPAEGARTIRRPAES